MKNGASHKSSLPTRMERDTMGELAVPADAYYGVQTARAIENFPISPLRIPRSVIRAMGMIKRAAASVNHSLGLLKERKSRPVDITGLRALQAAEKAHKDMTDCIGEFKYVTNQEMLSLIERGGR